MSVESSRQRRTNGEELDMDLTGATLPHPNASAGINRVGERPASERGRGRRFEFGRELRADGRWIRQESVFRRWVTADSSSGLPAVAGRYSWGAETRSSCRGAFVFVNEPAEQVATVDVERLQRCVLSDG
jgi:hypothetical protein